MSSFALDFLTLLFDKVVELHTSVLFPGTNWSIFTIVFFGAFGAVVVSVLRRMFGLASGAGNSVGGNNGKIKISKERQGDTR